MNLASLLVIPHPAQIATVAQALSTMAGVDIALRSAHGDLIITIETANEHETDQIVEDVSLLEGVLSLAMV
jgi:nitrate reductase NapAB chaperone NapD